MSSLRSPRSRRSVVGLVAIAVLVLSASACNPGRPPAATVNGTDVSGEVVDEIVEAYVAADPETYGQVFEGQGEATLSMEPVANVLSSLVVQVLQAELAADAGAVPTEEERTQAEDEVRTSFVQQEQAAPDAQGPSQSEQDSTAIFEGLSEETQGYLVGLRADSIALSRVLAADSASGDEAAQDFYDENPQQFTAVCVRLLAVPEADIPAVRARLDGGEDFAAVSGEVSTDPQIKASAASEPNCIPLAQLQQQVQPELFQDLAQAEEGAVVGPYPFDEAGATVALFKVEGLQVAAFEDMRDAILQQLPDAGAQAVDDAVKVALADADVSVDPRFGTWDTDRGVDPQTGEDLPPVVAPPVPPSAPTADVPVDGAVPPPG